MPSIPKDEAVAMLRSEIQKAGPADLAEYHNEILDPRVTLQEATENRDRVLGRIMEEFDRGLAEEFIAALWHIVFTDHRQVSFDEETQSIQYNEGKWPYYYVEDLR